MADLFDPNDPMFDNSGPDMDAYRARQINSLHDSMNKVLKKRDNKELQISTEISALTKEQQKLMQQLETQRDEFTTETVSSYNTVVKNLGTTIKNLSIGVKNITSDTAKATADAIKQYGTAVSEDININKQNTVAMALSRTTPLFGYFAAKFMETDVFKNAATNIRDRIGGAFRDVGSSIANMLKRNRKSDEYNMGYNSSKLTRMNAEMADELDYKTPKLQKGGFVRKGGLVEVHSGEVIAPIEKILAQIDKSDDIQKLNMVLDSLSSNMIKVEDALNNKETIDTQQGILNAILDLKTAMVGTSSEFEIAMNRMLLENPIFKRVKMLNEIMDSVVMSPFRALFSLRGGYATDVRKATNTKNVYAQQVNLLSLMYTSFMPLFRNISKFTRVTAQILAGETVSPTSEKQYTLFGNIKKFFTKRKGVETPEKRTYFDMFMDYANVDRKTAEEAGMTNFRSLANPFKLMKNMGINRENVEANIPIIGPLLSKFMKKAGDLKEQHDKKRRDMQRDEQFKNMAKDVKQLVEFKAAQEYREGPHSPSMAQNIATTAITTVQSYKDNKENEHKKLSFLESIKEFSKKQFAKLGFVGDWIKNSGKKMQEWFPLLFGFLSTIGTGIKGIFSGIFKLGGLLASVFGGSALKIGGTFFGGAKGIFNAGKGAFTAGAAGMGAEAGILSKTAGGIWGLSKGVGQLAFRGAGATMGLAVGGGMGLWDAAKAIITNPEDFVGNAITRGLAGFLGGTKSGVKGAKRGALKGGAIGAGIGTLAGGPIGTAIGGAFGALAGGMLGFIGGGRISKDLSATWKSIKDITSTIWKMGKFPLDFLSEGFKSIWVMGKFVLKKIDKMIGSLVGPIYDNFKSFMSDYVDMWFVKPWNYIRSLQKSWFKSAGVKFGGKWEKSWGDILNEGFKDAALSLLGPIPNLIAMTKNIGIAIDSWLSDEGQLGIIAKLYKAAKKYVGMISRHELASSLEKALNGETPTAAPTAAPKISSKEVAKNAAEEEKVKTEATTAAINKSSETFKNEMNKSTNAMTQATMNSANTIVSSNNTTNNVVSNNSHVGTGGWSFSSSSKVAHKVAECNIN